MRRDHGGHVLERASLFSVRYDCSLHASSAGVRGTDRFRNRVVPRTCSGCSGAMKSAKCTESLSAEVVRRPRSPGGPANYDGCNRARILELSARGVGPGAQHDPCVWPRFEKIRCIFFYNRRRKRRVEDVTREDVIDFLSSLYKEKLDSRSVARFLVSLRCLYKFALMEEMVKLDPTENLESPKIRQSLPTYLRVDEIDKLLAAPDTSTPGGLRDRAMLEVLYSTGLRVS